MNRDESKRDQIKAVINAPGSHGSSHSPVRVNRDMVGSSDWLDALVFIQFSRISPAGAQTMQAENEEAGDDEQETDASKP